MGDDMPSGNLVNRFWALPSSERRRICLDLGLMNQDDIQLPEPERYRKALSVAGSLGPSVVKALAAEVASAEANH